MEMLHNINFPRFKTRLASYGSMKFTEMLSLLIDVDVSVELFDV